MLSKFSFIFLMLFLYSCAGHITVDPRGCPSPGEWVDEVTYPDFIIEKRVWIPLGLMAEERVFLKDILRGEQLVGTSGDQLEPSTRLDCKSIARLQVETKSTLFDVIHSIIPFFTHKTIVVKGQLQRR